MKRLGPAPLSFQEREIVDSWSARQRDEDLVRLMAEPWGRRVAAWALFRLGRFHDVEATGEEGRRQVAVEMARHIIAVAPHEFIEMQSERLADSLEAIARVRGEVKKPEEETSA